MAQTSSSLTSAPTCRTSKRAPKPKPKTKDRAKASKKGEGYNWTCRQKTTISTLSRHQGLLIMANQVQTVCTSMSLSKLLDSLASVLLNQQQLIGRRLYTGRKYAPLPTGGDCADVHCQGLATAGLQGKVERQRLPKGNNRPTRSKGCAILAPNTRPLMLSAKFERIRQLSSLEVPGASTSYRRFPLASSLRDIWTDVDRSV